MGLLGSLFDTVIGKPVDIIVFTPAKALMNGAIDVVGKTKNIVMDTIGTGAKGLTGGAVNLTGQLKDKTLEAGTGVVKTGRGLVTGTPDFLGKIRTEGGKLRREGRGFLGNTRDAVSTRTRQLIDGGINTGSYLGGKASSLATGAGNLAKGAGRLAQGVGGKVGSSGGIEGLNKIPRGKLSLNPFKTIPDAIHGVFSNGTKMFETAAKTSEDVFFALAEGGSRGKKLSPVRV